MYLFNTRRKHVAGGTITKRSIATAVVTGISNSYAYTGEAVAPTPTVRLGDTLLAANEDYTVAYSDNTAVGMATVTITGKGNYYGTAVKTFYITAAVVPASWADFEFTNLGDAVASVGLRDSGAVYESSKNLDAYHIQVLPDGRIHFGAQLQGHAYIWGFEEGHPFDIGHFKSTYDSRSPVVSSFGSSILYNEGRSGYYSFLGGTVGIKPFTLSTAYDLSTRSSGSALNIGASGYAMHMAFSADGKKFFAKPYGSLADNYFLWQYDLSTPFDVSTADRENPTIVNLNTLTGETYTWRDFFFSPDGRHMVATSGNGLGLVHKFSLSTPWDITTLSRTSHKQIFSAGAVLNAVAVNDAGTKMIVYNKDSAGAAGYKFYEYDLTSPSPSGGWANFNLANLGSEVASASLSDSGASAGSDQSILPQGVQVLSGNRLFFPSTAQTHMYIWGFEDGHPFEVGHFGSSYLSRGAAVANIKTAAMSGDGLLVCYDVGSGNAAGYYKVSLATAFSLATGGNASFIGNSSLLNNLLVGYLQFSSDGTKVFYGSDATNSNSIYYASLSTAWNVQSKSEGTAVELTALSGAPSMVEVQAFQFSPDGKALVFAGRSHSMYVVDWNWYVVRADLSTAWDLSTATVSSYKKVWTGNRPVVGIAVNDDGTKMILVNGSDRKFYEYNLTS